MGFVGFRLQQKVVDMLRSQKIVGIHWLGFTEYFGGSFASKVINKPIRREN